MLVIAMSVVVAFRQAQTSDVGLGDHRGAEFLLFLLGTGLVAVIVIAMRAVKARREKPPKRMFE
jgi:hypothetical protein